MKEIAKRMGKMELGLERHKEAEKKVEEAMMSKEELEEKHKDESAELEDPVRFLNDRYNALNSRNEIAEASRANHF